MAEQDVRIRISVPAADISGIAALTRKTQDLQQSLTGVAQATQDVADAGREGGVPRPQRQVVPAPAPQVIPPVVPPPVQRPQGPSVPAPVQMQQAQVEVQRPQGPGVPAPVQVHEAQVEVQAGARVEVQRPPDRGAPAPAPHEDPGLAPPPSRDVLQRELQAVQLQQGQVDMATAPRLMEELRRKRQEIERQLTHLQQGERGTQRQERLERPVEEGVPGPTRAPVSPQVLEGRQLRLEAMKARLQGLEARRAELRPDHFQAFGRYHLDRQIAALSDTMARLGQLIRETPTTPAPAAPGEDGTQRPSAAGGGRRPPRPPRGPTWWPWRRQQPEPEDEGEEQPTRGAGRALAGAVASGVGRAAGGLGRFALGGSLATIGATAGLALLGGTAIQKSLAAMEQYEQRVRSVGQLNRQLGGGYQTINAALDDMRERYKQLIPETLDLLQGFRETGEVAPGAVQRTIEAATGAAVALGLAPRTAGTLQGRFDRVFAERPDRQYPLINVARAQQPYRYRGLTNEQFLEQVGQIGATGGYNLPPMSMDLAARLTNFFGGMGQRFVGQQANMYQEFAARVGPSGQPLTEAIRHMAIARLAERTPGGMLTIGTGEDAEQVNLRTPRGRLKAMELAASSPQMWEAYLREGERLGLGEDEQLELMQTALAPGMQRATFDRLVKQWRTTGNFADLQKGLEAAGITGGGKKDTPQEVIRIRLAEDEPTFKRIIDINAAMDQKFENIGNFILKAKLATQEDINGLLDGLVQAFDSSKTVLQSIDDTTKAWAEEYRRQHPGAPAVETPGTAAPPRIADDPGYNPSYNRLRDPDDPVGWNPRRTSPTTPQRAR